MVMEITGKTKDILKNIEKNNDKNVIFYCDGKEVELKTDQNNPLKLVNGIDSIEFKIPAYRMANTD